MRVDHKLSRRALLAGTATLAAASYAGARVTPRRKPNFVVILADDLGAFDLSCYGRPDYRTPHIDSLARDGMKFNFGYANSSSCAPTRIGLISGRYQNRLEIGSGYGGAYPSATIGYSGDLPSLPRILKNAGYRTALFGKWDLGELPTFSPNRSGYDEFFGIMGGGIDYWTHESGSLGPIPARADLYENETPVEVEGYATDLFTDRACDFIRRSANQPFLLSLHYNAPHWPWQTRSDRAADRINDVHYDGGSPTIYAEMMRALDDGVGRVLATLDRHRLSRDTVLVFTSDNGGERYSYMWPLRGEKGDLWEGGVRVPLIVRWPGQIRRGSTTDQVAMSMDFLPTFAAMAGTAVDPTAPPDGIDLSPQLRGGAQTERIVFWKTPYDMLSALAYPWKYVSIGAREYLFNLAEDPTENANLKLRQPDQFNRLKIAAQSWSAQMRSTLPSLPADLVPRLRALEPPFPQPR